MKRPSAHYRFRSWKREQEKGEERITAKPAKDSRSLDEFMVELMG
jgi:hypothetical protein